MKIASFALHNRIFIIVTCILIVIFGIDSYQNLGRYAMPNFTIKTAMITTAYPGASPKEVEEEVTDVIEEAVQKLGELDYITSTSQEGFSVVFLNLKATTKPEKVEQIWDKLRRRISDAQANLPPGAQPSIIKDDFGDVYGIFFAITGEEEGYSYADLKKYAKFLKKELLLVKDVAKVDFWGIQQEVVYVEFDRNKMATLGISPNQIYTTITSQNAVEACGKVKIGTEYIRFQPTGNLKTVDVISNLYVGNEPKNLVRLKDVARVYRGYLSPPKSLLRFSGKKAIGIGISIEDNGNIVKMGNAVEKKLQQLKKTKPAGIEINKINFQPHRVSQSLNGFFENFIESIAIVFIILLLFMGIRSGFLISTVLVLIILGTFIAMRIFGIDLQLMSLGALIVALGMLVDNAIVVTDDFLIKLQRGMGREEAAVKAVSETQMPLLGATLIAILAFAAIGFSPGNTGEFCRSLFDVIAISLLLSWIFAITITPLFCIWFLPNPKKIQENPYDTKWYLRYRKFLHFCIRHRIIMLAMLLSTLFAAFYSFQYVPKAFFASSDRNQFLIDYWKPEGTHIETTKKDMKEIEKFLLKQPEVKQTTAFTGEGALRFVLAYDYQSPNSSYGQFLLEVKDYRKIKTLIPRIKEYFRETFPDSEQKIFRFKEGPPVDYELEVRFRGPDLKVLHALKKKALEVFYKDKRIHNIRQNWRQRVKVLNPSYNEIQGRQTMVTRSDLNQSLLWNFIGIQLGLYRENDELIPIISRPLEEQRASIDNYENIQVLSSLGNAFVPLRQVVNSLEPVTEDSIIHRRNRLPTITVQGDPVFEKADTVRRRILPKINAIEVPPGYTLEWGGEYEEDQKGQTEIKKAFQFCILGMFMLLIGLFASLRQPVIIFLTIPLALIGVIFGLLATNLPFGFMSILGTLGLSGMLIKNGIVLLDQINLDLKAGKKPYLAVLDSSISRLRPVMMAAWTTIFGMAPLLFHPFFCSMAATVMGGLFIATILTLLIIPILYVIFFRINVED